MFTSEWGRDECSPLLPGLLFVQQLCRIESVILEELAIDVGQPAVDLVGWRCVWFAVLVVVIVVLVMVNGIHLETVGPVDRGHFKRCCIRHVALCVCVRVDPCLKIPFWVVCFGFLWLANAHNFSLCIFFSFFFFFLAVSAQALHFSYISSVVYLYQGLSLPLSSQWILPSFATNSFLQIKYKWFQK